MSEKCFHHQYNAIIVYMYNKVCIYITHCRIKQKLKLKLMYKRNSNIRYIVMDTDWCWGVTLTMMNLLNHDLFHSRWWWWRLCFFSHCSCRLMMTIDDWRWWWWWSLLWWLMMFFYYHWYTTRTRISRKWVDKIHSMLSLR